MTPAKIGVRELPACPVPGCTRRHGRHLLMCRRCWGRVPRQVQQLVYRTYDNGSGLGTPAYGVARRQAIAHAAGEAIAGPLATRG